MTREDVLKNAVSLLGIAFPVDPHEFKVAYRRACFIYHPDKRGDEEQFKKIQEIYRLVKDDPSLVCSTKEDILQLVDGTPISSLGLGLGPTTNGVDCEACSTKGYTVEFEKGYGPCPSCEGSGKKSYSCKPCNGTGKFTLRNDRQVECRVCKGSGKYSLPRKMGLFDFYEVGFCAQCVGRGIISTDNKLKPRYYRCTRCEGTGEIPIYNPVIPKGALVGNRRSK